jgi:hypothetical protein
MDDTRKPSPTEPCTCAERRRGVKGQFRALARELEGGELSQLEDGVLDAIWMCFVFLQKEDMARRQRLGRELARARRADAARAAIQEGAGSEGRAPALLVLSSWAQAVGPKPTTYWPNRSRQARSRRLLGPVASWKLGRLRTPL